MAHCGAEAADTARDGHQDGQGRGQQRVLSEPPEHGSHPRPVCRFALDSERGMASPSRTALQFIQQLSEALNVFGFESPTLDQGVQKRRGGTVAQLVGQVPKATAK